MTRRRNSMCQGLGPEKHDDISEIDRIVAALLWLWLWPCALWEGWAVVIPFFEMLQLDIVAKLWWDSGEVLVKFLWNPVSSGEIPAKFRRNSGRACLKRGNPQQTHNSAFPHGDVTLFEREWTARYVMTRDVSIFSISIILFLITFFRYAIIIRTFYPWCYDNTNYI